jgi:ABC-type antimicrobial peptide transport system permease subunit
MLRFVRTFASEPLRIVGVLWPLALVAPFVPGLPRPSNGGPTWRQEAAVALLLSATLALLWRRTRDRAPAARDTLRAPSPFFNLSGLELTLAAALAAFVVSLLATVYPAWQAARVRPAEVLRYE